MNDAFLPRSDWTQRCTTAGRRVVDSAARIYPRILGFNMTLTNVASKLMHASSFAARFNKGNGASRRHCARRSRIANRFVPTNIAA